MKVHLVPAIVIPVRYEAISVRSKRMAVFIESSFISGFVPINHYY